MMKDHAVPVVREVRRPNNTTIRYSVRGPFTGATIVFVHGWACSRNDFSGVARFLSPEYRVLTVDLAEHGESRSERDDWSIEEFARDVLAVLDAEEVAHCVVAGHSLGGAVAVEVARLRGEIIDQVVGLDSLHYLDLYPHNDERHTALAMRPFYEDFDLTLRGITGSARGGAGSTLADAHYRKMITVRQPAGTQAFKGLLRWNMEHALGQMTQPITVFAVGSLLSGEAIARFGDRVDFVPVDFESHHFPAEQPEATARLLAGVIGAGTPRV
jgi:pimeloyl-ACP methyl ester carboxylesterase